eukprot:gnl/TRDRNA2_/TRDRNA2_177014_c0_seq1.p1 gnl/TRDRNA2_/TRDRNA2_177014_c0~~gnl/TRDRNA2_/TRDRNA2_177014_c0_seq1.p1  ORF type:complete len:756 (-),score=139.09 gnl/TRDRNA2_/TRDRNA2_177014_c0_seq1:73-2340(-)
MRRRVQLQRCQPRHRQSLHQLHQPRRRHRHLLHHASAVARRVLPLPQPQLLFQHVTPHHHLDLWIPCRKTMRRPPIRLRRLSTQPRTQATRRRKKAKVLSKSKKGKASVGQVGKPAKKKLGSLANTSLGLGSSLNKTLQKLNATMNATGNMTSLLQQDITGTELEPFLHVARLWAQNELRQQRAALRSKQRALELRQQRATGRVGDGDSQRWFSRRRRSKKNEEEKKEDTKAGARRRSAFKNMFKKKFKKAADTAYKAATNPEYHKMLSAYTGIDTLPLMKKFIGALMDLGKNLLGDLNSGKKVPVSNKAVRDISVAVSPSVSAQTAKKNGALLTADDLAGDDGFRGEDVGPAGKHSAHQGDMLPALPPKLFLSQNLDRRNMELIEQSIHRDKLLSMANASFVAAGKSWAKAEIAYCYAPDVPQSIKDLFKASTAAISRAVPCIKFTDVGHKRGSSYDGMGDQECSSAPAMFIMSNPGLGCYSYVGMLDMYPSQQLQMQDPGCLSIGTMIHEIGHALGMAHEHVRKDRDQFVNIHFDNIIPGFENQFQKSDGAYTGNEYDLLSVMQYDAFSFANDISRPTISSNDPSYTGGIGQRSGLSSSDVDQLIAMYTPEDASCSESTMAGIGCVDKHDDNGGDPCLSISACEKWSMDMCCVCGGGVSTQCYKDQPCNQPEKLPEPDAALCIEDATGDDETWADEFGCIIQNTCDYAVKITCASTPECEHEAAAGGYFFYDCQEYRVYEICEAPEECKVTRL